VTFFKKEKLENRKAIVLSFGRTFCQQVKENNF
jgi:hypothetical protein